MDKLSRVNELIDARDGSDSKSDEEPTSTSSAEGTAPVATTATPKAKPKLSKARTMKNTAKVGRPDAPLMPSSAPSNVS